MWTGLQIQSMAQEQGEIAAEQGLEPHLIESQAEIDDYPPFPFPNIGTHRTSGWEELESYFCDSSGFGQADEPALTPEQLKRKLRVGFGYAVTKVGQFQLYVTEFKPVE